MVTKRKPKKNKSLDCTCKLDTDAGFDTRTGKGTILTSSCVCVRKPGKKELAGVGKVNLKLE